MKTLRTIEGAVGTLSQSNNITPFFNSSNVPMDLLCTDCVKAAYNLITDALPSLVHNETTSQIQDQCGANFTGTYI